MVTFKDGCSSLLGMTQIFSPQKTISPNTKNTTSKPQAHTVLRVRFPYHPMAVKYLKRKKTHNPTSLNKLLRHGHVLWLCHGLTPMPLAVARCGNDSGRQRLLKPTKPPSAGADLLPARAVPTRLRFNATRALCALAQRWRV